MKYYPVFLDLNGKLCLIVGGGRVAERKVRSLLRAGARVKVVSPKLTLPLSRLKDQGKIAHKVRPFRRGDLRGAFLAIAATDDRAVNENIFQQAQAWPMPVNVVDDPAHSSFIVPSLINRGDLLIAFSTSGRSPALAKALRQKLQKEIGKEYTFLLRLLGAVRPQVLSREFNPKHRQKILHQLAGEKFLSLIRRQDFKALEARLKALLGPDFSLKELGRWQ